MTTETDGSAAESSQPARGEWPPNDGGDINDDTLGADYPADRRLYQRFRFEIALRPSTPATLLNGN